MGDSGLLKSALFFLCVILVALLVMPKDCARRAAGPIGALQRAKSRPKGLHIETATPPPKSTAVTYPAGIDGARLQYSIEIDSHFAAPMILTCPKRSGAPGNEALLAALQSLHYVEAQPDGNYAFTHDGLLNLTATDNGTNWSIPVAKRQFIRVTAIDCAAADQCTVEFLWQWQPNDVGQAMQPPLGPQKGTAKIIGGPGGWVVAEVGGIETVW